MSATFRSEDKTEQQRMLREQEGSSTPSNSRSRVSGQSHGIVSFGNPKRS